MDRMEYFLGDRETRANLDCYIKRAIIEVLVQKGLIPETELDYSTGNSRLTSLYNSIASRFPEGVEFTKTSNDDGTRTLEIITSDISIIEQIQFWLNNNKGYPWIRYIEQNTFDDGWKYMIILNSVEL